MKILIFGNGFDLAHYLPTSFRHVMAVLRTIEGWSYVPLEIGVDDVFAGFPEDESDFLARSKVLYTLDGLKFDAEVIRGLKDRLGLNLWYRYFDHQHNLISSWVDFEHKIGEALTAFLKFFAMLRIYTARTHTLTSLRIDAREAEFSALIADPEMLDILVVFGLIQVEYDATYGLDAHKVRALTLSDQHVKTYKQTYRLDESAVLTLLNSCLTDFVQILETYLTEIVGRFMPQKDFVFLEKEIFGVTDVYSFNYTSTFLNLYQRNNRHRSHLINLDYLHGQAGNPYKKLVLGVHQVQDQLLAEFKAYGFLKYHQKLFNNTDYHFLSENRVFNKQITTNHNISKLKMIEFVIWGHSLDPSDHEYIREIFAFNPGRDEGVRVKVLFHNETSRFALLSNLLHVLGKDTTEYWMKKNWLRFEPVPDVYALNCAPTVVALEPSHDTIH